MTRLGVNQFWYNHWSSNSDYYSKNQINHALPVIIKFFVNYGLTRVNNPYMHEYWYNSNFKKVRTNSARVYMHYYKRNFYTHDILGIEHTFLIRHKTGEYFPLKTWYMSYNNWIILAMHWYKPNKKKRKLNPMTDHNYLLLNNNLKNTKNKSISKDQRLILSFVASKNDRSLMTYSF